MLELLSYESPVVFLVRDTRLAIPAKLLEKNARWCVTFTLASKSLINLIFGFLDHSDLLISLFRFHCLLSNLSLAINCTINSFLFSVCHGQELRAHASLWGCKLLHWKVCLGVLRCVCATSSSNRVFDILRSNHRRRGWFKDFTSFRCQIFQLVRVVFIRQGI